MYLFLTVENTSIRSERLHSMMSTKVVTVIKPTERIDPSDSVENRSTSHKEMTEMEKQSEYTTTIPTTATNIPDDQKIVTLPTVFHQCAICNKAFTADVDEHLLSHCQRDPPLCVFCDKGFPGIPDLKTHLGKHAKN